MEVPPASVAPVLGAVLRTILAEWSHLSVARRVLPVACVPLHFIFALTVPIVDYIDRRAARGVLFVGASRHLLALNLLVDPLFLAWGLGGVGVRWGSFPA